MPPTHDLIQFLSHHRDFFILTGLVLTFALGLVVNSPLSSPSRTTTTVTVTTNTNTSPIPIYYYSSACPSSPNPSAASTSTMATSSWFQKTFTLPSKSRGSYLITDEVVSALPELKAYKVGILHLFVQHTSCALSLNENWDSDVREDMSDALDRIVPEDRKGDLYRHAAEGRDDMPAHVKSALIGASVTVPISNGRLATGTWQGIWYLEFRAARHSRKVVATIQGEKA